MTWMWWPAAVKPGDQIWDPLIEKMCTVYKSVTNDSLFYREKRPRQPKNK